MSDFKIQRISIRLVVVLLFSIILSSCEKGQRVTTLTMDHNHEVGHPIHKTMLFMAERLKEKSGGTMILEIYPNQQLGSERECLELLQIGSLAIAKVSVANVENFVPELKVFSLPFLFRAKTHFFKVLDSKVGKELLADAVPKRLKGLVFMDSGSRNFYTKTSLNGPDDLKGLKMRVMPSKTAIDMVKSLGGSPTPVSWGELYTALQQGIVDGAENNLLSFQLSYHYEVCNKIKVYPLRDKFILKPSPFTLIV